MRGARRATKAHPGSGNLLQAPGPLRLHSCLPPSWSQPPGAVSLSVQWMAIDYAEDVRFQRLTTTCSRLLLLGRPCSSQLEHALGELEYIAKLMPRKHAEIKLWPTSFRYTQGYLKAHHGYKGNSLLHLQAFLSKEVATSSFHKRNLNRYSLASFSELAQPLEPELSRTTQQRKFPLLHFKLSSTLHTSLSRC